MSKLANWKCHKIVKAGKITMLPMMRDGVPIGPIVVEDAKGETTGVEVNESLFARNTPAIGDYLVIYDDGYKSWSPAKAFEDGYARI